jgi:hypothetical protein
MKIINKEADNFLVVIPDVLSRDYNLEMQG